MKSKSQVITNQSRYIRALFVIFYPILCVISVGTFTFLMQDMLSPNGRSLTKMSVYITLALFLAFLIVRVTKEGNTKRFWFDTQVLATVALAVAVLVEHGNTTSYWTPIMASFLSLVMVLAGLTVIGYKVLKRIIWGSYHNDYIALTKQTNIKKLRENLPDVPVADNVNDDELHKLLVTYHTQTKQATKAMWFA